MTADPVLEIRGLRKSYGRLQALDGIDLEVARGEVVGLLGHNGAGKSTLVSIVAGLRAPDAGSVHVTGVDVARDPVRACRHLGLAPQETAIYPEARVRDNLRVFGELAGMSGARLRTRIEEVAVAFGLTELMTRRAQALSGGQQRRVHTAVAVLHRPPLLLLDEPTVGSDVGTRDALLEVVRGLAHDGAGVCYSTHYLPEIEALDATVAVLERGRLLARGTLAELVAAHARSAVELTFDGPAPALTGATVAGEVVRLATDTPARTAAQVLASLPDEQRARVRSIDLVRDDLESAYRALTGRAAEDLAATEEVPA